MPPFRRRMHAVQAPAWTFTEHITMPEGKIIKGIAGFYYVRTEESGIYECKAKGAFRREGIRPLPGDEVCFDITHAGDREGNITRILPRRNELIRPAASNIDQALVFFAVRQPDPNLNLLDRFLLLMEKNGIPSILCFNKSDLARDEDREHMREFFAHTGYPLFFLSAKTGEGLKELTGCLKGKTTILAGPSGTGKSTFVNRVWPDAHMETGQISAKIERGRHTTRHCELIRLARDTYLADTPGFTSLSLDFFEKEELESLFAEFIPYTNRCRFVGCSHIREPDCAVREAVREGKISAGRYEHYVMFYQELAAGKKY